MKRLFILMFYLILAVCVGITQILAQDGEPALDADISGQASDGTDSDKSILIVEATGIPILTLEAISSGNTSFGNWKYHPGDESAWASPTFDDSAWEVVNTMLPKDKLRKNRWEGIGWFRLHLSVPDERLHDTPLALHVMYQVGASEIYLDGELIYKFGSVGTRRAAEEPYWERNPQVISFSGKTEHVIAVRYSNFSAPEFVPVTGFLLRFSPLNSAIWGRVNTVRGFTTVQMVWTAIAFFLMVQHFLLFIFYPRARENLYFAISVGSIGTFVFLIFQFVLLATGMTETLYLLRLLVVVLVLAFLSTLLFLYTLFYPKLSKLAWFFAVGWGLLAGLSLFSLSSDTFQFLELAFILLNLFTAITFLEIARVIIVAIFKKKDGAWIFGLGSLLPFILPIVFGLLISYTKYEEINWQISVLAVTLAPLFSMSVYLARNFSRTHRKLETEVLERQLLEVENTRKTEELEEARELQLSMLPQASPELPNLDIAFEMRPATEVGGDYYDYNLTEDGQLTIAIGDATGHGLNAGLVVSAVKSLFKTAVPEAGNLETLERISQGIKSMNLKRLYMAMTLVTFDNNRITLAAAGMPPALLYRANEDEVEEIFLEGMPLGGFIGTAREEASYQLQSGDTILLMSDGLPEMLNPENEMLGYPKTKELFAAVANRPPKVIINHIFKGSTSWANGEPQADDVTLVVIKVN